MAYQHQATPSDDHLRLVDNHTRRCLDDQGLTGCDLAETIDVNGVVALWIVDRSQIDDRNADLGEERPPHEIPGIAWPPPEPRGDNSAVIPSAQRHDPGAADAVCGAPTATGHRCRIRVRRPGARCRHHRAHARHDRSYPLDSDEKRNPQ